MTRNKGSTVFSTMTKSLIQAAGRRPKGGGISVRFQKDLKRGNRPVRQQA